MKIKKLKINHIGPIDSMVIEPNSPLNIFYGDICQGKTTILNAVKLCFGGSFPSDVIKHNKDEASVELLFDNASIRRSFYRNKSGETVARGIEFIRDGILVQKPVEEIKKLLNPFLLEHEYLQRMSELERKKYFTELFDINTEELDAEYLTLEENNRDIRATVKGYGEIKPVPVEKISVEGLSLKKTNLCNDHEKECTRIKSLNSAAIARNQLIISHKREITEAKLEITRLQGEVDESEKWLKNNPLLGITAEPDMPKEINDLEQQILTATADNVKYEQYLTDKKRAEEKESYEKTLKEQELRQRQIRKTKIEKLQAIDTGIKDLSFDDEGNIVYQGTMAGMLSTSQTLKLSTELSSLYPEGFGLSLIDRGESLGKSIFGFIEEAKRDNKTIFATVVGDKAANIPDDIGVYVIKDGRIDEGDQPL